MGSIVICVTNQSSTIKALLRQGLLRFVARLAQFGLLFSCRKIQLIGDYVWLLFYIDLVRLLSIPRVRPDVRPVPDGKTATTLTGLMDAFESSFPLSASEQSAVGDFPEL